MWEIHYKPRTQGERQGNRSNQKGNETTEQQKIKDDLTNIKEGLKKKKEQSLVGELEEVITRASHVLSGEDTHKIEAPLEQIEVLMKVNVEKLKARIDIITNALSKL